MAKDLPASFLNPDLLGPIAWVAKAEGRAAVGAGRAIAAAAAEGGRVGREMAVAAKEGAVKAYGDSFMNPLGMFGINPLDASTYPKVPDIGDVGGVVGKAGDDLNKLANKAIVAEVVLVGGVVAVAAIAAWYLSKSEEGRAATKNAVLTGGKFLLTKGRG